MELGAEWLTVAIDVISNVGFPIFVALFLLHRMEAKLDNVVKALQELSQVIKSTG